MPCIIDRLCSKCYHKDASFAPDLMSLSNGIGVCLPTRIDHHMAATAAGFTTGESYVFLIRTSLSSHRPPGGFACAVSRPDLGARGIGDCQTQGKTRGRHTRLEFSLRDHCSNRCSQSSKEVGEGSRGQA